MALDLGSINGNLWIWFACFVPFFGFSALPFLSAKTRDSKWAKVIPHLVPFVSFLPLLLTKEGIGQVGLAFQPWTSNETLILMLKVLASLMALGKPFSDVVS
jgi:hypothetical protein